MFLLNYLE